MVDSENQQRFSIAECLSMLGISRQTFYRRVKDGKYQTVQDGRRKFMTAEQLQAAVRGDSSA